MARKIEHLESPWTESDFHIHQHTRGIGDGVVLPKLLYVNILSSPWGLRMLNVTIQLGRLGIMGVGCLVSSVGAMPCIHLIRVQVIQGQETPLEVAWPRIIFAQLSHSNLLEKSASLDEIALGCRTVEACEPQGLRTSTPKECSTRRDRS